MSSPLRFTLAALRFATDEHPTTRGRCRRSSATLRSVGPAARRLLLRDSTIVASTGCLWWFEAHGAVGGTGGVVLGVLAGLSTGVVGFLAHEWGHAIAARLGGATIYFADRVTSPFLFFFDTNRSTPRQFIAMSIGGYIASALALVVAIALLPRDQLSGQVGLFVVGLGVVATLVAELPTTIRVARGGSMPRGYVYRSEDTGIEGS